MVPDGGNKILCFSFPLLGSEARDIGFRLFVYKIDKKGMDFLYDFGSAPPEGEKAVKSEEGAAGRRGRRPLQEDGTAYVFLSSRTRLAGW